MSQLGRILLLTGATLAAAGLLLLVLPGLPWIGRLPGDVYIKRGNFIFYFPIATAIIISIVATILFSLLRR